MMSEERRFEVDLSRLEGFEFKVDFGLEGVGDLVMDEPEPVGGGSGPNASKVLAAAVGNCLSTSLLFCLQRAKAEVGGVEAKVSGVIARNEEGRWRIRDMNIELEPEVPDEYAAQLKRCSEIFENFCIVSQSIQQGIPISVKVLK
ncbi:MAG: OsmC family protein [Candidatus Bathyarchaeota archaeon]|nr:MAG: OsmC family protein [Candidatus Bathyarchaeota archaeon]